MNEPTLTGAQEPEPKPHRKKRRWWLKLLLLLLLLLVCLAAALTFFLGTEPGLRSGYALVRRLAPDLIHIERLEGRLAGELQLEGVRIQTPTVDIVVERFRLHWQPSRLLVAKLRVVDLLAQDVTVTTKPSADEPESRPLEQPELELPHLELPLQIELKRALVERLSILGADASQPFEITAVELAAAARGSEVTLHRLSVALPRPELAALAAGRVALRDRYPLDLQLGWELRQVPKARLVGQGKVSGDLARLQVEHSLSGSAEAQLTAQVLDVLNRLRWQAALELEEVDLPAFGSDLPTLELQSQLTTEGSLEESEVEGHLKVHVPGLAEYGHLQVDLGLTWREQILTLRDLELRETESGAELAAEGRWNLADGPGELALKARWEQMGWPLPGDRILDSERGQLRVDGRLDRFRYQLSGQVRGPDIPETAVRLAGTGDMDSTHIEKLDLDLLDGHASLRGKVTWAPALSWEAKFEAKGIDPGLQWSEWPGRLEGLLSSAGTLEHDQLTLEAAIETLQGELRGYPVKAAGEARMQGSEVQIEGLALQSGASRLELAGGLGSSLDLLFKLDSPDLRSLLPDAAGSVQAEGSLRGTLEAPQIKAWLKAVGVDVAGQGIQRANGNLDLGLGAGERVAVDLKAEGLALGGMQWRRAGIQVQGEIADHSLEAVLQGEPLTVNLTAQGGLSESRAYQGQLRGLELRSADFGDWRLEQPGEFRVAGAELAAGPLCVRAVQRKSRGCVAFEMPAAGSWKANVDIQQLSLALLAPFLPKDMEIEGAVEAKAAFEATNNLLNGSASVTVPQGKARLAVAGQVQELDFSSSRLESSASPQGLQARLDIPLAGLGGLEGDLILNGWRLDDPAAATQALQGRVQGRIDDLSLLATLVQQLDSVRGNLALDLKLGGTLGVPEIQGNAGLQEAGFEVPLLGLDVQGLEVKVVSRGLDQLEVNGRLKSGDGELTLSGGTPQQTGEASDILLELEGDRLTVANTPEYFALVSPNVQFEVAGKAVAVTGELVVPEARIRPRSVPEGSVSPSSDVVISAGTEEEQDAGLPLSVDVVVRLGEEVSLDGFGVKGDLEGELRVFRRPGRLLYLGDGQLAIKDGSFRLPGIRGLVDLGQALEIKQGRILFAKTPLDNPGLLLLVKREEGDASAGMRVSGTLRNPKMTFFSDSDPGMSQSEAMNYMLTGKRSMSQTSRDERDQGLAVGTYVSPKLYMEYESASGDEANKVRLRYDLNKKVQVQTETGDQQGLDIFYKFER